MMPLAKTKLMSLIELMNDQDAESLLSYVRSQYVLIRKPNWAEIETVAPDEIDQEMLKDSIYNPDCQVFMSQEDLYKELGFMRFFVNSWGKKSSKEKSP